MDRDPLAHSSFDPARSEAPGLPDAPEGGALVLVIVASSVQDRAWAERSAVALASGWAARKRRILLADLSLIHPGLHREVGVENGEGMTDAFLFGSSILRVARPVRERGFLFVPAGTATARPEAVAASPRWTSMVEACDRIGATLVVFLPSDLPGGEYLRHRATDVFLLTDVEAPGGAALRAGVGDRLRAVLTSPTAAPTDEFAFMGGLEVAEEGVEPTAAPSDAMPMPGSGPEVLDDLGLDLSFQAPDADDVTVLDEPPSPAEPESAGLPEPPAIPEWARASAETEVEEPVPAPRSTRPVTPVAPPPPPRGNGRALALGGVALVAAVVAAAFYGVIPIPGFGPGEPAPEEAAVSVPAPAPVAPSPATEGPVLGASLTLGAFTDAAVARLQAQSLGEQRPDLLFVVSPVESDGTVYYRLLAGPAEDSLSAVALRDSLATTLTRENPSTWLIRPTPLAFNLGERAELEEARARVADLASVDIPAYVLELPPRTESGALRPRFRVYGGAFADEAEATYFQSILVAKGFPDARLIERQGRHPE